MGTGRRVRSSRSAHWVVFYLSCCVLFFGFAVNSAAESTLEAQQEANEATNGNYGAQLDIARPTSLLLSPSILLDRSPGSRAGVPVLCERIRIHGLSRIRHLRKMAYSVKVKVFSHGDTLQPTKFEVCFHRNSSLGVCKCPQNQWEKVAKGSWSRPMSPFDRKLLDIRVGRPSSPALNTFEVSVEEEFFLYRITLLLLGLILMTSASSLSQSLVFYYSSAMAIGVILVILVVLFQGMKLLPTGRKSSLAIFIYSSLVGLGSFLLRYLPGLLRSILVEMGISEDMYIPLAIFLLAFVVLTGAWLGFWVVRKLIVTEDGSVDLTTSNFVAWSIRILSAVMILQCSLDPMLAAEALILGIVISALLGRVARLRFFRRLYRKLFTSRKDGHRRSKMESPTSRNPHEENTQSMKFSPISGNSFYQGYGQSPSQQPSTPDTFYSTFHSTPERRQYSKDEWKQITRDYTKRSLEELVSSPEFSKWAVANAERITLAPRNNDTRPGFYGRLREWLPW